MTKEQAEFLEDICNGRTRDYSGRGMHGHSTQGVVTEETLEEVILALWYELASRGDGDVPDPPNRLAADSMGRDEIVIY